MIKAVIFDIGGVLIRTADHSGRLAWEECLGLANGEAEFVVFNSEMGIKAQVGEISDAELWDWVGKRLDLSAVDLDAFRTAFWSGDVLDEELVKLIRRLRPRYQTAVISNATRALRETLRDEYQIADAFDLIVGSAEEKVMKPDRAIYIRTLERLNRKASEAVFIDDFEKNIAAARELGMKAIHFVPGIDVVAELARFDVHL
jgi:epoxide hydrolase-like predicted phosphatase